jgi:hypothetical protein
MASPPALGLDEHLHLAPDAASAPFTPAHSCPPSPTAIAAATTLATLSDGRPLHASYPGYDEDEGDDYGGAPIALPSADLSAHTAVAALADTYMTEQAVAEQLAAIMFPYAASTAVFDSAEPIPSHQMPSVLDPIPHFSAHTSSSDPLLEPLPPALQEAQLNIENNICFAPITSFFHRITPARPTVPGLDLVDIPVAITLDQLQGDRFDPQGIDWNVRNTTRSYVRAKRAECESAQLPPQNYEVRKVSSESPVRAAAQLTFSSIYHPLPSPTVSSGSGGTTQPMWLTVLISSFEMSWQPPRATTFTTPLASMCSGRMLKAVQRMS